MYKKRQNIPEPERPPPKLYPDLLLGRPVAIQQHLNNLKNDVVQNQIDTSIMPPFSTIEDQLGFSQFLKIPRNEKDMKNLMKNETTLSQMFKVSPFHFGSLKTQEEKFNDMFEIERYKIFSKNFNIFSINVSIF